MVTMQKRQSEDYPETQLYIQGSRRQHSRNERIPKQLCEFILTLLWELYITQKIIYPRIDPLFEYTA